MEIRLLTHRPEGGWSSPLPSELDGERTLVLVFAATTYAERLDFWAALLAAFPRARLAGCSTAGEIVGDRVEEASAVVVVARFERVAMATACVPIQAIEMSRRAGAKLGRALSAASPRAVIVLSDGLQVNGSDLALGIAETLPATTRVIGGLAADATRFARTWTLVDGVPRSGWVTAVSLSGPLEIATASRGGWRAFGPERTVTRAERNVLYEIDGRPALALYKTYLGEYAAGLPGSALYFPLAILSGTGGVAEVVRSVVAVDEHEQSVTYAGDVPQGARARLMRATVDRLIEGAACAGAAASPGGASPALAIAISSVGRRLVLGERTDEETAATLQALPPGSSQAGFYAYGEMSPSDGSPCALHNQTMTLATLREAVA